MEFDEFKNLHNKFSGALLTEELLNSLEYERYSNTLDENKEFYHWTLKFELEKASFNYENYCCPEMAYRIHESLDDEGEIDHDNLDAVIHKWSNGTYGIPIHDGGTSVITINFCPWCGTNLDNNLNR
ncbi:DUF6980 family protein [Rufibacter immobilis]|uniref:DUF6980 family protein n=1 Tax=Rufibacter immobilis TaxID=1348778 RepID=UPI0035E4CE4F